MDSGPNEEYDRSSGVSDRGPDRRDDAPEGGSVPVDAVPLPYQILDSEGRIRTVNDAWLELLGYDEDDAVGMSFRSLLVDESRSAFERLLARCAESTGDVDGTFTLRRADDALVVVSLDGHAVGGDDERQIHCQLYEITDHRQRKVRLEWLEQAVEASGHAIYLTDPEGKIQYVNPAFEEITGYTADEAIGATPRILSSGEMSEEYYTELWGTLETGERWAEEIRNRCKDGSLYHARQTIAPVTDNGDVTGFVAVQADITEQKQRQQELAESRERLRVLFEESPDAITVHGEDGEIIGVNQQSVESLGYSRGELLSMTIADIEVGHDEADLITFWTEADFERNHAIEGVHRRKDGTEFPVEVWVRKIEFGGETQFIALSRDISDKKERKQELERKEFLFERVQEIADIGIWEYRPADDELWWSDGVYEIYGVDSSFEPTIESAVECYVPEDQERIQNAIQQALETGDWYEHDIRFRTADGERRYARARGEMTETETGEQLLRGVFQDVTEQKERERTLERYERLVENLPLGVYRNTAGDDGEFTLVNQGMVEMFDADSKAELRERQVRSLYVDPDEREQFSEDLVADGTVRNRELELETLAGDRIWGNITAIASTVDGEVVFDGVVQDISARKAYEQRLKEQRDNLDILNQVLRHDIRNDLQVVLSYAQLLEDHVGDEGTTHLETVLESTNHAIELTRTARELAEVMRQSDVENKRIRLIPTIDQVVDQVESTHPDAEIRTGGSIPDVSVVGDEILDSVFRNLLENAVQHNDKETPEVTLSVSLADEQDIVEVRVADNGPGIPDSQKAEIFGKGEKGLESDGTGVGLYLVQTLVDSYGGEVWVEDRADRRSEGSRPQNDDEPTGSVFVVQLPIARRGEFGG